MSLPRLGSACLVVLLLAGCGSAEPAASPAPAEASASAPAAGAATDLLAAVRKTAGATFAFTVSGRTKDGAVHRATGVFDPQGHKLRYHLRITGDPEATPYHDEILVGSNDWMRTA